MKTVLMVVGATTDKHFIANIEEYVRRVNHYMPFGIEVIPELRAAKHLSESEQKAREGDMLLKALQPGDYLVLLDEYGIERRSIRATQHRVRPLGGEAHLSFAPSSCLHGGWSLWILS